MTKTRAMITTLLVCSTTAISFSTDCLSIVLEFNGVLAAIPLAYIIPAACYLRLAPDIILSRQKLPALLMFIFGIFMSISGLVVIFVNWLDNNSCSHGVEMPYCLTTNNSIQRSNLLSHLRS